MVRRIILRLLKRSNQKSEEANISNDASNSAPDKRSILEPSEKQTFTKPLQTAREQGESVIENEIESVIKTEETTDITVSTSDNYTKIEGVRRLLPDDVVKLAALNSAFKRGLISLERLNLDDDLYWKAVEDLRRQYYKERQKYI